MKRYHINVHGRVQGVGFRFYTEAQASDLNIKGWVKNNRDGTVEIDAEGEDKQMAHFLSAVKTGSDAAKVTNVDIEEHNDSRHYTSFEIK